MAGLLQHRLPGACLNVPSTNSRPPQRMARCTCAAAADDTDPPPQPKRNKLPGKGFFAEADTEAVVYSPLNSVNQGNIYERGGRYSPEFLWNTNWQDQLALEEAVKRQQEEARGTGSAATPGGLSLRRVADLNSMDVDLTEQLLRRNPPRDAAQQAAAAATGGTAPAPWQGRGGQSPDGAAQQQRGPSQSSYPRMPPRRGEAKRWERTDKFAKRAPALPTTPEEAAVAAAVVTAERAAYARYKQQLLVSTAALGGTLSVVGFATYSKDVALSYAVGAVLSVVYLNMLNRSIDAVGASEGGSAAAQPRLLIPIILAMGYNRWNTLAAEHVGVTLQLMPMLLGFLTYKGAVIAKGAVDLFGDLAGRKRPSSEFASPEAAAQQQRPGDAQLQPAAGADEVVIGRDYANRILQG